MATLSRCLLVVVLLQLIAMLGGCATFGARGPVFTTVKPAEGESVVVFYRPGKFVGHRAYYHVALGDEVLVSMTNGGYFEYTLRPGRYTFQITEYAAAGLAGAVLNPMISPSHPFDFDLEAGRVCYVRVTCVPTLQLEKPSIEVKVMGEQKALQELEGLKRFEPGKKDYWI